MSYNNIPLKKEQFEKYNKLKDIFYKRIPELKHSNNSHDRFAKFLVELIDEETLVLLIDAKKDLLREEPESFDISYNELIKRTFRYFKE